MGIMTNRKMRSGKLLALLISLIFAAGCQYGPVETQDVEETLKTDGQELTENQQVGQICEAAKQGSASAQTDLGVMYFNGDGLPKDDVEAAKWFRKASERGYPAGQVMLRVMCSNSEEVPKDTREAVKWFRKAAEQGHTEAQYSLGILYDQGVGVPEDDREAVKWYRKAAEQGHAESQSTLGYFHHQRIGVELDVDFDPWSGKYYWEAVKWYQKAAEQGHAEAQFELAVLYQFGEAKNIVEAIKWYRKSAEQGYGWAISTLGFRYYQGSGVSKDYVKAYAWMSLAIARGNEESREEFDSLSLTMTAEQIAEAQILAAEISTRIKSSMLE